MFQSGHRRYDQDDTPQAKGEDSWRYVAEDYAKQPPKPALDELKADGHPHFAWTVPGACPGRGASQTVRPASSGRCPPKVTLAA